LPLSHKEFAFDLRNDGIAGGAAEIDGEGEENRTLRPIHRTRWLGSIAGPVARFAKRSFPNLPKNENGRSKKALILLVFSRKYMARC
jgi:hypothetical protein